MASDRFVCPICRKMKRRILYHCPDHCMDMCEEHVRKLGSGRYLCIICERPVNRIKFDGGQWVEA